MPNRSTWTVAFRASRYGTGEQEEGDYINCPFTKEEYYAFVDALCKAERIELRSFRRGDQKRRQSGHFFEGCLPVEIIAERGIDSLAFGPMRPVGIRDPRTGKRPYAVVQLRQDNLAAVFITWLAFRPISNSRTKRVSCADPRVGKCRVPALWTDASQHIHRIPETSASHPAAHQRDDLFFAGQITGVEGYMGNIATGLLAGINARACTIMKSLTLPQTTMLGALCHYVTHADLKDFQPMKANFGILPPLEQAKMGKTRTRQSLCRARAGRISNLRLQNDEGSKRDKQIHPPLSFHHWILLIATLGWYAYSYLSQPEPGPLSFDGQRAYADVETQVAFGPRIPGSEGHARDPEWMRAELESAGWQVEIQESESLGHPIKNRRRKKERPCLRRSSSARTMIRACSQTTTRPCQSDQPVPGANDGASGVAVLLELARSLPEDTPPVWLVFFRC
jgi:hypothetical protein